MSAFLITKVLSLFWTQTEKILKENWIDIIGNDVLIEDLEAIHALTRTLIKLQRWEIL